MHRLLALSLFILFANTLCLNAQGKSYIDSLKISIKDSKKEDKVNAIIAIPFDIGLKEIKAFERLADSAIHYSEDLGDTLLLAQSYEKKILALHFTSKAEEALKLSLKCIELYEKLKDTSNVGNMYSELAWKLKHHDINKAFEYMRRGIKIREHKFVDHKLFTAYDFYGILHGMKNQWDSAKYYHKKVIEFRRKEADSIGLPFVYTHLANAYLKTKRFDLAEKYLDSSLQIRKKRKDIYGITDSQLYFGDLFFEQKNYENAVYNYEKAYKLASEHGYYPLKKHASEYLYKSYRLLNNHEDALKYHVEFTKLKDSITNVETSTRIAQLEIEYETEKKEKEILSQRADLAEQKLDISEKNTQLLGLGLLAIVLALLGYLFYNQQKQKNHQLQKENELKDALVKIETQSRLQEQRLRISRDLHDNIGAQLTFIISSLDNLKYGFKLPEKLGAKLETISEFTSSTIYELRDTIWAMNKTEISLEDLQSRISNFIEKANTTSDGVNFKLNSITSEMEQIKFTSVEGMNIYRIIQESINNAMKYSEAKHIIVDFSAGKDNLVFKVYDDGKGFDIDNTALGNGIHNMKKRAHDIGADIEIVSEVKKGTTITLLKTIT